jgi:hypothetical protein
MSCLAGGFRCIGNVIGGKPCQFTFILQQQGRLLHSFLHPLSVLGAKAGELCVDRPEPFLPGVVQLDP